MSEQEKKEEARSLPPTVESSIELIEASKLQEATSEELVIADPPTQEEIDEVLGRNTKVSDKPKHDWSKWTKLHQKTDGKNG